LTAINYGYPILGEYGEEALKIRIEYIDGDKQEYIAKNGVDVCICCASVGSSRINPICERAIPFARFSYDKNFEEYIINKLELVVKKKTISRVILEQTNSNYDVLIYGIYID